MLGGQCKYGGKQLPARARRTDERLSKPEELMLRDEGETLGEGQW